MSDNGRSVVHVAGRSLTGPPRGSGFLSRDRDITVSNVFDAIFTVGTHVIRTVRIFVDD